MTVTDFIIFFLNIFFLMRGASRGFMKSLLGPFSIIVATILSIIYYQNTKDLIVSLLIGLIGPLLLHLLLKFLLKAWANATNTNIGPNFISRLTGAILTLLWGWVFIILTLLLVVVLPPWGKTLTAVRSDVTGSGSYYYIAKPLGKIFFAAPKQNIAPATNAPSNPDVKSLADDPRFQKILQDPDIQKEINAHDMVDLMRNPKIMALTQQIMNDPATMKKLFAVYQAQVSSHAKDLLNPQQATPNP
jgi:uncharacterized membrane protein required for colicin V production